MAIVLRLISRNSKHDLPMQNFTQDDYVPNPSTILFLKQFARMCNSKMNMTNGYNGIPVVACC